MRELTNICDGQKIIRWKLLASASILTLATAASSPSFARDDHALVWIELGGTYTALDDGQETYAPPFAETLPASLPSPSPAQRLPGNSLDWNGQISFEPGAAGWVFAIGIRYGRSSSNGNVEKILSATQVSTFGFAPGNNYVQGTAHEAETHTILDFKVGKDVGLGRLAGTSVLSAGIRVAQFTSSETANINAITNFEAGSPHDVLHGQLQARRSFHGLGPELSWDASASLAGSAQDGELTLDWGANVAVLFGRRKSNLHNQTSQTHFAYFGGGGHTVIYANSTSPGRSHSATIPNVGGFVGFSVRYPNAKVSIGYRADEFFGAEDGGIASARTFNVGFYGPFAGLSIGLGG